MEFLSLPLYTDVVCSSPSAQTWLSRRPGQSANRRTSDGRVDQASGQVMGITWHASRPKKHRQPRRWAHSRGSIRTSNAGDASTRSARPMSIRARSSAAPAPGFTRSRAIRSMRSVIILPPPVAMPRSQPADRSHGPAERIAKLRPPSCMSRPKFASRT